MTGVQTCALPISWLDSHKLKQAVLYLDLFPNVNVPTRTGDICAVIQVVCATRIMGRPISGACACFKVIVLLKKRRTLRADQVRS